MKYRIPVIVQCLVFLIPLNIYIIGDWLGTGVQWALFRYQRTYMGNSLIFLYRDLNYVFSGIVQGRSALSLLFSGLGTCLLVVSLIILLFAYQKHSEENVKKAAVITILSGFSFLLSYLIQYGVFFHGPSGIAIPIGIPVILLIGWWMYHEDYDDAEYENEDEPYMKPE